VNLEPTSRNVSVPHNATAGIIVKQQKMQDKWRNTLLKQQLRTCTTGGIKSSPRLTASEPAVAAVWVLGDTLHLHAHSRRQYRRGIRGLQFFCLKIFR